MIKVTLLTTTFNFVLVSRNAICRWSRIAQVLFPIPHLGFHPTDIMGTDLFPHVFITLRKLLTCVFAYLGPAVRVTIACRRKRYLGCATKRPDESQLLLILRPIPA
jgi:hypothetical protein